MVAIKEQLCGLKNAKNSDKCKPDEFAEVQQHLPDRIWNEYFVFTVVRNPWVRMLSAYNMFNKYFLHKCAPQLWMLLFVCTATAGWIVCEL